MRPVLHWACEQADVVPFRRRAGAVEIALITTGDRKRWLLPKGWIDAGEDASDAALREAEEEAGCSAGWWVTCCAATSTPRTAGARWRCS